MPRNTCGIRADSFGCPFLFRRHMSTITSANLASAIVKLVAAEALPALVSNLVMGNLVNRDYEPILANAGDTVNVPISPVLVANNIAEGRNCSGAEPERGECSKLS